MKKIVVFTIYYLLLSIACLYAQIDYRFSNSQEALYYLEKKGIISAQDDHTTTRLDFALTISRLLDDIFSGRITIDKKTYSRVEILIEEFKDELKMLKLKNEISVYATDRDTIAGGIRGRFIFSARNTLSKPDEHDSVTLLPAFNFAYKPYKTNFGFNLGFKSASGRLKVDEANVNWSENNFGSIRFGRIYFFVRPSWPHW